MSDDVPRTPGDRWNPRGEEARWWRQFLSAVRLNADNAELLAIAGSFMAGQGKTVEAMQAAAKRIRELLPYKFLGARHRVLELDAAIRRGFGACADATAALCAVALMRGDDVDCCYETLSDDEIRVVRSAGPFHGYAHVRVAVGDARVDAYEDASLNVPNCSGRFLVTRSRARWPTAAASPIRTSPPALLLAETLPEDGER